MTQSSTFRWNHWPYGLLKAGKCACTLLIIINCLTVGIVAYDSEGYNTAKFFYKVGGISGFFTIGYITLFGFIFFVTGSCSMYAYIYGYNNVLPMALLDAIESSCASVAFGIGVLLGIFATVKTFSYNSASLLIYCVLMLTFDAVLLLINAYFLRLLYRDCSGSFTILKDMVIDGRGVVSRGGTATILTTIPMPNSFAFVEGESSVRNAGNSKTENSVKLPQ